MPVENVVAKYQGRRRARQEFFANQEGLREPVR